MTVNSTPVRSYVPPRGKPRTKFECRDSTGIRWVLDHGTTLIAKRGEATSETVLRGTPLSSKSIHFCIPDREGGLFFGLWNGNHVPRVTDGYVYIRPDIPRLTFRCSTSSRDNQIDLILEESSLPEDSFRLVARIDEGPWRPADKLISIPEGPHKLTIEARPQDSQLFTTQSVIQNVNVSGDFKALLDRAASKLGASVFEDRKWARVQMIAAGPAARTWLLPLLEHPDPEVRTIVEEVLDQIHMAQ